MCIRFPPWQNHSRSVRFASLVDANGQMNSSQQTAVQPGLTESSTCSAHDHDHITTRHPCAYQTHSRLSKHFFPSLYTSTSCSSSERQSIHLSISHTQCPCIKKICFHFRTPLSLRRMSRKRPLVISRDSSIPSLYARF